MKIVIILPRKTIIVSILFLLNYNAFSQGNFRFFDFNTKKWGVKDSSGKTIIEPIYHEITSLNNFAYKVFKSSNQVGIIDYKGNELLPFVYNYIYNINKDIIHVKQGNKVGLLNNSLECILPLGFRYLAKVNSIYIAKGENNSYGILDSTFNVTTPFIYYYLQYEWNLKSDYFIAQRNNMYGLIDSHNNEIIPFEYNHIYHSNTNQFVAFNIKNEISVIFDSIGNKVISIKNGDIRPLAKDRFAVKNEKKLWAIYEDSTKQLIDFKYNEILNSGNNIFFIAQNNQSKWGAVDYNDNIIVPFIYNESFSFINGTAYVKNNYGKFGFINEKGINTTKFVYDEVSYLPGGFYRVTIKNICGLVTPNGYELITPTFSYINAPFYDRVIAGKNKKSFLLDLNKLDDSTQLGYDYIDSDIRPPILVKKNGLLGFIDWNNNVTIPIIYQKAKPFTDSFTSVQLNGESFIINKDGKRITKL